MSLYYSVCVLDLFSTPGVERIQDLGLLNAVDMQQTKIHPTTSTKSTSSTLVLTFPQDTPNLNIRELMEVWAGWRDSATGIWSEVDNAGHPAPPFGGYILSQKARLDGNEKQFQCTLTDYNYDLRTTLIRGWPNFVNNANPASWQQYPPGYSLRDWLVGRTSEGKPFDGVLVAAPDGLGNGVRFDAIDPIYRQIIFNADTLPGTVDVIPGAGNIQGYYGFLTLDKIIQALVDMALITYAKYFPSGADLVPGYWMGAAIDGTRLVPQFHLINQADQTAPPDLLIAADWPLRAGEIPIADYWHERIANDVQTVPVIQGIGGDETVEGLPLVYAIYDSPAKLAQYPTAYQLRPGRGGDAIFLSNLHTVALAEFLVTYIGNRVWGAQGSFTGTIDVPVSEGQRVRFRNPNEAIDRIYPITSVEANGDGSYAIQFGYTQPTIQDVLKGGLADMLLIPQDLAWQNGTGPWANRAKPNGPKLIPPTLTPITPVQNHITSGSIDIPAITLQSTLHQRVDDRGHKVTTPAPVFRVKPPLNADGTQPDDGTWVTPLDGRPHPITFYTGRITDDTTDGVLIQDQIVVKSLKVVGTCTVDVLKNGSSLGGPLPVSGPGTFALPPTLFNVDDELDWVVTDIGSAYIKLAVGEA